MLNFTTRTHPEILFAYTQNSINLVIRVENKGELCWAEADVTIPDKISLSPANSLNKGRARIGIIDNNQFLEKGIKIYASPYTTPQMYRCKITVYSYNKDGNIENRVENVVDIRCEIKKKEII